jgi:hypothetical protein
MCGERKPVASPVFHFEVPMLLPRTVILPRQGTRNNTGDMVGRWAKHCTNWHRLELVCSDLIWRVSQRFCFGGRGFSPELRKCKHQTASRLFAKIGTLPINFNSCCLMHESRLALSQQWVRCRSKDAGYSRCGHSRFPFKSKRKQY